MNKPVTYIIPDIKASRNFFYLHSDEPNYYWIKMDFYCASKNNIPDLKIFLTESF